MIFYVEYSERLLATNSQDGIIFSPLEAGSYKASDEDIKVTTSRWSKNPDELGFEKAWLVWNEKLVLSVLLIRTQAKQTFQDLDQRRFYFL